MMNGEAKNGSGLAAKLARPNILELQPYRCARDDYSEGVLLDANENALGPTSVPSNSLDPYDNHLVLERYPDPYQITLKEKYAAYRGHGLSHANIFCGVGSDEAIDLLIRIFCKPGVDNILITPPTYGMYTVCAKTNDVEVKACPLSESFDLRVSETLESANAQTKLLFICSPGNPTSKAISLSEIEKVAASSRYEGIVVVDEAYVDFSDKGSAVSLTQKYPNIVVLQTLSKAFGLAGIRCGFAIGASDVIQLMNNVKAPYNVNSMTSEVAINAVNSIDTLTKNVSTILEQRDSVVKKLNSLSFVVKVFSSDSNFLLFRIKEKAKEVYTTMAARGVVVRYRGNELHCFECLRVTIGTAEENQKFLELLIKTYEDLT
mmetsp:Transcript_31750/g.46831  ORF Transcript_31750/g.46831 Transcript_31750/m.46831 type:complete len:376 (-) Transcript_31750:1235-2362(-)